jgi:YVTN family beta-propeller protein
MRIRFRPNAVAMPPRCLAVSSVLFLALLGAGCGDYYRPVAQPIQGIQPSPVLGHSVIAITTDGITDNHRGNGMASNIDTSGDSIEGNLRVGLAPAHAAVTPNGTKLYVANSAEDTITANNTASPTVLAAKVSLPSSPTAQITQVTGNGSTATYTYTAGTGNFLVGDTVFVSGCTTAGFNGAFTVTAASGNSFSVSNSTSGADNPESPGAQAKAPNAVFLSTADNNNMYAAGYSTNSAYVISTSTNVVSAVVPVGLHPVALAELPNLQQVYVANQGSGTISVISTINNTVVQTIAPAAGAVPVWVTAKRDSSRVYVLDANGTIYDLNPLAAAVVGSTASVGAGANSLAFDPVLNRLYVTNPTNSQIGILDAGVDPPALLRVIDLSTAAAAVCSGCAPDAVTVLGDGSRAYVAAYQFAPGCADDAGNPVNCVSSFVAVIDGLSATFKSVVPNVSSAPPVSTISTAPALSTTGCGIGGGPVPAVWQPGPARFRLSIVSSGGETNSNFKVYVGQCDAGNVAVIDTYPAHGNPADTYAGITLPAALSTFPPLSSGLPPLQNPVFLVAGP